VKNHTGPRWFKEEEEEVRVKIGNHTAWSSALSFPDSSLLVEKRICFVFVYRVENIAGWMNTRVRNICLREIRVNIR
jgi:hypothetical protein